MFKSYYWVESGSDRDEGNKRREYVWCNKVRNWATWVASWHRCRCSLTGAAWLHLPFRHHKRVKGKNIMTLHFCSPLALAFTHFIIIFMRPRGCGAVFAFQRRTVPGQVFREDFILDLELQYFRGGRT